MIETQITLPELALVAGTRAALGFGLGLLMADRFSQEQRRAPLLFCACGVFHLFHSFPRDGDDDRSVPGVDIALQVNDLLPGAQT